MSSLVLEGARYQNGELCLMCSPPDGVRFVYAFKKGEYDILPHKKEKKKRSPNANAYAWVLIDKIAEKVGLSPDEVYRNQVRNMAGVSLEAEEVPMDELFTYTQEWCSGHLGRQIRYFPAYRYDCVNVIRIKGSSDYDTKQMSRFIDGLVQDALALGIETKDPNEIQSLLNSWEARK